MTLRKYIIPTALVLVGLAFVAIVSRKWHEPGLLFNYAGTLLGIGVPLLILHEKLHAFAVSKTRRPLLDYAIFAVTGVLAATALKVQLVHNTTLLHFLSGLISGAFTGCIILLGQMRNIVNGKHR